MSFVSELADDVKSTTDFMLIVDLPNRKFNLIRVLCVASSPGPISQFFNVATLEKIGEPGDEAILCARHIASGDLYLLNFILVLLNSLHKMEMKCVLAVWLFAVQASFVCSQCEGKSVCLGMCK